MPRHTFRFPREVVESIKQHVRQAIDAVEPNRYRQEANYTAAVVNRLEGTAYKEDHGEVVFHPTVFDDRGSNSAEHRLGADHAVTAAISGGARTVKKVILVQPKLGSLDSMSGRESDFLKNQLLKMKKFVDAPKVMQILEVAGRRFPQMVSGNRVLRGEGYRPMDLTDYFVARVTTTLDGGTDPTVISIVQDSSITRLHLVANLHR